MPLRRKFGYTTGSHVLLNHIYTSAFQQVKLDPRAQAPDRQSAQQPASGTAALDSFWRGVHEESFLSAAPHLGMMLNSIMVIRNEMALPAALRMDAPIDGVQVDSPLYKGWGRNKGGQKGLQSFG